MVVAIPLTNRQAQQAYMTHSAESDDRATVRAVLAALDGLGYRVVAAPPAGAARGAGVVG